MLYLGWLYKNGEGVDMDEEKADELFAQAFEAASENDDYSYYQWVLGNLYYDGFGGAEQDFSKALAYVTEAA